MVEDALEKWAAINIRLQRKRQPDDPPTSEDMAALSQAVVIAGKSDFWGVGLVVDGDAADARPRHDDSGNLLLFTSENKARASGLTRKDVETIRLERDTIRGALAAGLEQGSGTMGVCINGDKDMTFPADHMAKCYELADAN
jgi:hypothetical protein